MNKNNVAPEIRISGFMDSINKYKLADVVDRVRSYPLSRNVETNDDTGYRYVHYGDIHTKVANIIDLNSNLPNIECGNYDLLKKGDIILADASEDYQGIATPSIVNVETPYKLVAGLHTIAFRPKKVDSLYLYYLFNSKNFRKYGYRVGTGMKVFGISVSNVMKYEGLFPSVAEQSKIGLLFKKIDETITLQQQLLTDYKQFKKALLQQMFPQKGKTVPKIRFTGFNEDWKKERLSKYLNEISDKSTVENQHTILSSTTTGIEIRDGRVSGVSNLGYKIIKKGNVVLSPQNLWMGNINYNKEFEIGLVSPSYKTFSVENAEECFLVYYLKLPKMIYSYGQASVQGASVVRRNLDIDLFNQIVVLMPNREEQEKIGNFFKQLDETIEGHEQKLAIYQELKKALLQRMFV